MENNEGKSVRIILEQCPLSYLFDEAVTPL